MIRGVLLYLLDYQRSRLANPRIEFDYLENQELPAEPRRGDPIFGGKLFLYLAANAKWELEIQRIKGTGPSGEYRQF